MYYRLIPHLSSRHTHHSGARLAVAGNHAGWSEYTPDIDRIRPSQLRKWRLDGRPILLGRHDHPDDTTYTAAVLPDGPEANTLLALEMFSFILVSPTPMSVPTPTTHPSRRVEEMLKRWWTTP
jgi:hypothetical protein